MARIPDELIAESQRAEEGGGLKQMFSREGGKNAPPPLPPAPARPPGHASSPNETEGDALLDMLFDDARDEVGSAPRAPVAPAAPATPTPAAAIASEAPKPPLPPRAAPPPRPFAIPPPRMHSADADTVAGELELPDHLGRDLMETGAGRRSGQSARRTRAQRRESEAEAGASR